MTPKKRLELFSLLKEQNPNPATELNYHSEFELLVAVMLSAQATDKGVNKATAILFSVANTPQKIIALGEDQLRDYIKSINFYRTKAAHLMKTCQLLIEKHHACVPNQREALEALPGVGRKTANVLLNTLFGFDTMAVDTHIYRVANRTGLAPGKNVREVEEGLLHNVPAAFKRNAHHWLVLHGRYVCIARQPKCSTCVIEHLCAYTLSN
jgi:endonuclease-3